MRGRVLGLVVLVAAGCGGGDAAVRHVIERWNDAVVAHDNAAACSELSVRLKKSIDRHLLGEGVSGSCRSWAARYVSPRNPGAHRGMHVTAIDVSAARASARLSAPGAVDGRARLVREHGHWRIDDY